MVNVHVMSIDNKDDISFYAIASFHIHPGPAESLEDLKCYQSPTALSHQAMQHGNHLVSYQGF